jgi:T3SS (YopN, CesT) and YbjN peptide-binding chaperone 3
VTARRICRSATALATALLIAGLAQAHAADDLRAFLANHRCAVVERLELIHARGNRSRSHNRFLVVGLEQHGRSYVQCLFVAQDTRMLCEASSGFYAQRPGEPRRFRLAPEAVAALGRLGFSTDDAQGNYRRELELGRPPNLVAVADLMLSALYEGYGARLDTRLKLTAPMVPRVKREFSKCALMS